MNRTPETPAPGTMIVTLNVAQLRELIGDVVGEYLDAQAPAPVLVDDAAMARALDISTETLRRLARTTGMPHVRVGDVRRWEVAAVLEWLRAQPLRTP